MAVLFSALLLSLTLGFTYSVSRERTYPDPVPLRVAGVIGNSSGDVATFDPEEARGAEFLTSSNVLRLPDGRAMLVPEDGESAVILDAQDPRIEESLDETRTWLNQGRIPGHTDLEREVATRSLLDLRLLTSSGATIAAPTGEWDYVWPRDASWASVAFSSTGHHAESLTNLRFLGRVQEENGEWEARYLTSGRPVRDGRGAQLDGSGWFLWAVWFHANTSPEGAGSVAGLWPQTKSAADAAVRSLGHDGLPPGGADYWEIRTLRPNLGTSAALLVGLRSASDIAADLGHDRDSRRYGAAAARLDAAIEREFSPHGYTRTTWPGSGLDSAVTFLGPPFGPENLEVRRSVDRTSDVLTVANGGVIPGEEWPQEPTVSWTPETAFFMLSASAGEDKQNAERWFRWLESHRTETGSFAEKVDSDGSLRAAAPLAWTSSAVVIALAARGGIPVPPEPDV